MTKKEPSITPESARGEGTLMRVAADLRWADPTRAWGEIAQEVGVDPKTVYRWRQTEQWELTFRAAGMEHIERLAPRAVNALVLAWEKGNAAGALDVLRSFGFLNNERIEVDSTVSVAEVIALRDRLRDPAL